MAKRPRKPKNARTPHPEENFVGDPNQWSDARKKEESDYLDFGEIGRAPGINQSGISIPEMPGPLRPMKDRIAQALNDPNATVDQLRFRRELAESHPEVFEKLMNGAEPKDLAHLIVTPSIESRGPSKAAKALRDRQQALAQKKLSDIQQTLDRGWRGRQQAKAAANQRLSQSAATQLEQQTSGLGDGSAMDDLVAEPSFPRGAGPLSPEPSDWEGDRTHLGPIHFEQGPPSPWGPAAEGVAGPTMGAAQLKNRGRLGRGSRALDVEEILQAAGVTKPGMLNKAAASLVSGVGLGRSLKAGATPGMKQGMVGKGLNWAAKQAVHSPIGTGLTALAALQMLAPGVMDSVTSPVKGLTGGDSAVDLFLNNTGLSPGQPVFSNRLANQGQLVALQDQMRLKAQRDAQTAAQNTALLFQTAPHVAAQIMAGRRLPKGAVVIGGTPRVDLMQEMAMSMGQGQFEQQDPMQQILERQQGGAM